jgi:hypothetical protein
LDNLTKLKEQKSAHMTDNLMDDMMVELLAMLMEETMV